MRQEDSARVLVVGDEDSVAKAGLSGDSIVEVVGSLAEAAEKHMTGSYARVIVDPVAFDTSAFEILAEPAANFAQPCPSGEDATAKERYFGEEPSIEPHPRRLYAGLIPVVLLAGLTAALRILFPRVQAVYEPPLLLPILNTLFIFAVSLVAAYTAMKSYLASGLNAVLMLGCGALALGTSALAAGWLLGPAGPNTGITVFNISVLAAAVFHTAALKPGVLAGIDHRASRVMVGYGVVVAFVILVAASAARGLLPPFCVAEEGPTLVRQSVLVAALLLYAFTSACLMIRYSRSGVRFLYWYSLGLALLAIAMVDLLMLPAVGSLLNWVGRFAQYVAGGYFVVALLSAADDARSRGTQLQDALAEVWGGIGTYWRDIAEPRHEQELLRQSEERFRAIFDQGGIGIALGTLQGMILQTNAAYQGMVGYDADDLTSMNFVQITHPEDLEKELVLWDELVSNKRKAYRIEKRYITKDGEIIWVRLTVTAIAGADGEPALGLAMAEDITERKMMQDHLSQAQKEAEHRAAQLQSFISSMAEGVALFDAEGCAAFMNDAGRQILGIPSDEPIGDLSRHLSFSPEPELGSLEERIANGVLRGETVRDVRHRIVTPSGEAVIISVSVSPVVDAAGGISGATCVFRDITEQSEMERQKDEVLYRERHIAEVLQRAILPPEVPEEIAGYDIVMRYAPALKEAEIGGDFYDVFDVDEDKFAVVIGDVAGKGLDAAIRVAEARHAIRSYSYVDPRPARVTALANDALCKDTGDDGFMLTVFLAIVDKHLGTFTYTSAGHEPPLVCSADGECEELDIGGMALGVAKGTRYTQSSRRLSRGDVLLMFTDGITEARTRGNVLFGKASVLEYLRSRCKSSLQEIGTGLLEAAMAHAGGRLQDDAAIVVLRQRAER